MTKSPFIVYILPVILSISLGTIVMAEALNNSERELNMWQFDTSSSSDLQELSIIGLEKTYSTSDSIKLKINVSNSNFDCGDLYITIYESTQDQVLTQSGYLKQCFSLNQENLPIDEYYSTKIGETGNYKIVIELFNERYNDTLTYTESFIVE